MNIASDYIPPNETARAHWAPDEGARGTRRTIEYAKQFLSLRSDEDRAAFRYKLASAFQDIDRTDNVLIQYERFLTQVHFTARMRLDFECWLLDKAIFIGSAAYDHELIYEELPYLAACEEFKSAYRDFVCAITSAQVTTLPRKYTVLFTGHAGGGHRTPACAIAHHLRTTGNEVQLIDVDLLESSTLPNVNGTSPAEIYEEVFQRQQNRQLAAQLLHSMHHLQPVEKKRFIGDTKNMIAQFQPSHIIACAQHRPELSSVSYQLGTPMTFVHTDYIFQQQLLPLLIEQTKLSRPLVRFTTPTSSFQFFAQLFKELPVTTMQLSAMHQFQRLDFPVRESFTAPTPDAIQAARTKHGIEKEAIVCKIAMGQSGITRLIEHILQQLEQELRTTKERLHVFVICGNNSDLQKRLQASLQNSKQAVFAIRGFLEEEEMAEIDRASDVWITKPGGATSAELLQMGKQMLYVIEPNHPWEKANAAYLTTMQRAAKFSPQKPLLQQLRERMVAHQAVASHAVASKDALPSNWKNHINKIIQKKD